MSPIRQALRLLPERAEAQDVLRTGFERKMSEKSLTTLVNHYSVTRQHLRHP